MDAKIVKDWRLAVPEDDFLIRARRFAASGDVDKAARGQPACRLPEASTPTCSKGAGQLFARCLFTGIAAKVSFKGLKGIVQAA
jgi:hypothetical protein